MGAALHGGSDGSEGAGVKAAGAGVPEDWQNESRWEKPARGG